MARPKIKRKGVDWKALMSEEQDFFKSAIRTAVQEFLEAEMDETIGAGKSERTTERTGYRSGYTAGGWSPGWASWSCGFRKTGQADSTRRFSSATNAARRHWWRPSHKCTFRGYRLGKSKRSAKSSAGTVLVPVRSVNSTRSWITNWDASLGASWIASIPI